MRGSIIKRSKSSYTLVLNLGIDPQTGKYKQQWISVKGTKKDAEKRLAEGSCSSASSSNFCSHSLRRALPSGSPPCDALLGLARVYHKAGEPLFIPWRTHE